MALTAVTGAPRLARAAGQKTGGAGASTRAANGSVLLGLGAAAYLSAQSTTAHASAGTEDYNPSKEEIAGCVAAIEAILDEHDDLGPTLIRLAWHASGTYDVETNTGGSDGATMRFAPESGYGANAGLDVARTALEPVKKLFPQVSYADLWTLAGAVAIEYMGGPKIDWRAGRRDASTAEACPPDGRLPDADKGAVGSTVAHVRAIFSRQGFTDQEMVALIGAHALGRCHKSASGYDGPWTRSPTTFSNEYYKELLNNTWTLRVWDGPDQFQDPSGDLMMLPADMALLWDAAFRKYVVEYANNEEKFFKDFAAAFQKLEENGVKALQNQVQSWWRFW